MGTGVRNDYPGKGHRSDLEAGFGTRRRLADGSLQPLNCTCEKCGRVYEYDPEAGHTKLRCNSCRGAGWASRPDRVLLKVKLVELRGGACHICGYDRHPGALSFHHIDPLTKSMTIASNHGRSWDVLAHEARKCALLCMNCHREVHDGVAEIPATVIAEVVAYTQDDPRNRTFKPQGRPRSRPDPRL
jgi:hypothetical protein